MTAGTGRRELLVSKGWLQAVALVVLFGFFVLGLLAYRAYSGQPPIPERVVDPSGRVIFTGEDVTAGQGIFLKNGLMQYGSIFGHGAYLVCAAKWENRQPQASAFPFASVYGPFGAHRSATVWAMVPRLAVRTPQPTHLSNPSSPRSRQQPRYWRRFMTLMRPSIPALNLLALLNHPCRSCSSRFSLFFPALGKHTFFPPISFASRSFSLECTLRSAATSSGGLPNKRR